MLVWILGGLELSHVRLIEDLKSEKHFIARSPRRSTATVMKMPQNLKENF